MKRAFLLLTSVLSFSYSAQAVQAYCDNMALVDNMPMMSAAQFKEFQKSKRTIDSILVSKDRRAVFLMVGGVIAKTYQAAFGFNPAGAKQFEGDGKTPEGLYEIDYKNPESSYHLSLHISYPNDQDERFAKLAGRDPGGDVMVHGFPVSKKDSLYQRSLFHPADWTVGCVGVTTDEITEIYPLVKVGTPIEICARNQ